MPRNGKGAIVKTGISGGIDVIFGNSNFGMMPPIGSTILVEYVVTSGEGGNLSLTSDEEGIFRFDDVGFTVFGEDVDLNEVFQIKCTGNPDFGSNPEPLGLTRIIAPKTSRSFVLANPDSYVIFFEKFNLFSIIDAYASLQPDLSPSCYDNALFLKGFLQNAAIRVNHPTLPDSSTTEQYYLFKSLHRRLAAEYAKPIAERKNVEELENRANDLEKELARKIAGYGEALRQVKWQEVQAALKPGEAAIEFVHYQYWNKKETDSTLYAALVLRPGMAQPLFVPLFEEKQLESLLAPNGQTPDLFYKNLYSWEGKGQTLRQLVWQPLEAALSGAKTVYFAPSGLLHRLNLGAIPSAAKATVGDHYRVVGLNSTRNVGRVSNPADVATDVSTTTAALFGGIQYDMDSTAVLREQAKFSPEKNNTLRGQLDFAQSDSTLRGGAWRYLPGSEKEVAEVEKIMANAGIKAQVFKGFSGSEARFKAMSKPSPRILHLATHGFFFPDPKAAPIKTGPDDQVVFKNSDHPLIRSGLVLAGGNYAWQTGKPLKSSVEDGILTAYEISQIDLSQTELVVLSACETGLGDIKGSEGIYGLQRAFKIAGAKRVLMSLWQVPDQQTSRLMGLFYKNWLSDKMPVGDALQAAKNTLRDRGYDPFYWAGFVLVE
jgi:CHAT domain-containing protein